MKKLYLLISAMLFISISSYCQHEENYRDFDFTFQATKCVKLPSNSTSRLLHLKVQKKGSEIKITFDSMPGVVYEKLNFIGSNPATGAIDYANEKFWITAFPMNGAITIRRIQDKYVLYECN